MGNEELLAFFNPQNSRDDVKSKFDEQVDSELINFINTKLELYNKLTEDRANTLFKNTWFNEVGVRQQSTWNEINENLYNKRFCK